MTIEKPFYPAHGASRSMISVREQLLHSFQTSKEYRHAFVEEKIRSGLAVQIKAIREQRGMSQTAFARLLNKSQSWVSRLEDPNQAVPIIPTLLIVSRAFDVDLDVRFSPFSELLNRLSVQTPGSLEVPAFDHDRGLFYGTPEKVEIPTSLAEKASGKDRNIETSNVIRFPQRKQPEVNPLQDTVRFYETASGLSR